MDYILYLYSAQTQKNLNLHIKTDPVMAGADATVYTVASAPIVTVLVFIYAKNLII